MVGAGLEMQVLLLTGANWACLECSFHLHMVYQKKCNRWQRNQHASATNLEITASQDMLLQQTKALTIDALTPRMHCKVRVYNAIV